LVGFIREGGGALFGGAEAGVVGEIFLAEHRQGGEGGGDQGDGGGLAEGADEGPEEEVEEVDGGEVEDGFGEKEGGEEVDAPDGEEEVAEFAGLAFDATGRRGDEGAGDAGVEGVRGGSVLSVVVERFRGEARPCKRGSWAVGEEFGFDI
jgi:hypothetical protein